jgi:hypothetical protein
MRSITTTLLLFMAASLAAQDQPPQPATNAANAAPVVEYARVRSARSHRLSGTIGLGDWLTVDVEHFDKLYADVGGNCAGIVLYLDARPMNGLTPESCSEQSGSVRYILKRTQQNDDAWHWLLGSPTGFTRDITISVGPTNTLALASNVQKFPLRVVPKLPFYIWMALMFAFLIMLIHLCRSTTLIRGTGPAEMAAKSRPFSLSRFQMAYWFFLVVIAYVFVWLITGELDSITESVLGLIGIGAGTALGSALIDANSGASTTPSRGFLADLLDDGSGISFHRFQMFVWTVVLGVIFCVSIYRKLAMPDFNATLLGLMGISSGTYLGFKFPEKTNSETGKTAEPPPQG